MSEHDHEPDLAHKHAAAGHTHVTIQAEVDKCCDKNIFKVKIQ